MGLVLAMLFAACVKERDSDGSGFTSAVSTGNNASLDQTDFGGLTLGEDGLVRCAVTRIKTATEFVINRNNPRNVRLAAIKGPNEATDPNLYDQARRYLLEYIGQGNTIYLRPLPGSNLKDQRLTIVGFPLLVSDRQPDPARPLFVDLIQGMLSRGLAEISDPDEFDSPEVMRAAYRAQEMAKTNRLGIWANHKGTVASR